MDLEQEFTNETGRCPDNDVQYYADWLEEKVKKLTTDNSDYAKLPNIDELKSYMHRHRYSPNIVGTFDAIKKLGNFA